MTLEHVAKGLLLLGVAFVAVGAVLLLWSRTGQELRIPGDMVLRRPGLTVYLPLGTSVLLSIILTLAAVVYAHFRR